jgi:hypothetical protein
MLVASCIDYITSPSYSHPLSAKRHTKSGGQALQSSVDEQTLEYAHEVVAPILWRPVWIIFRVIPDRAFGFFEDLMGPHHAEVYRDQVEYPWPTFHVAENDGHNTLFHSLAPSCLPPYWNMRIVSDERSDVDMQAH